MSTKKEIREAILNAKPKTAKVVVFGQEVEIRQASVAEVLSGKAEGELPDRATAFAELLIRFCYVPGTNEKVFDDTDVDVLKTIPLGEDVTGIQDAINKLMGIDIEAALKNLPETPSTTT